LFNLKSLLKDHIEYVKNLIGVDYIGIGADYDGVDLTPVGLEDVAGYPNLFAALIDKGWQEEDLAKLAGGNVIRVFKEVEKVKRSLRNLQKKYIFRNLILKFKYSESVIDELPDVTEIDPELLKHNDYAQEYADCRTY
jgi:hypothetical protein